MFYNCNNQESAIRGIKDHIYYFFTLCKNYENGITLAYDLSFGTIGYGVQLAFASKKVRHNESMMHHYHITNYH